MIAQERNQPALSSKLKESIQDAPAVAATIDVVAQGDDCVILIQLSRVNHGVQGGQAAVDVADRYSALCHV